MGEIMNQLLYILFGWILGISSTLIFRRIDRRQKIDDFKKGLKEQLKETLPILISLRLLIKNSFGELDPETIKWALASYPIGHKDFPDERGMEVMEKLLGLPSDQLKLASSLLAESKSGKGQ